jgi:hypothetical protein
MTEVDGKRLSVIALLLEVNDMLASIEEFHPDWDISGITLAEKHVRQEFGLPTVPSRRLPK